MDNLFGAPTHGWFYLVRRFSGFLSNLELTSLQLNDGWAKQARVRDVLNRHYWQVQSDQANGFVTGSWGKTLQGRPPRDVDLLFFLPPSGHARFEQRAPEWKRKWDSWSQELDDKHRAHKEWKRARRQQWRQEQRAWQQWRRGPSFVGQLLQILVVAFFLWLAYHRVPVIHDFLNACWTLFTRVIGTITQWAASQD